MTRPLMATILSTSRRISTSIILVQEKLTRRIEVSHVDGRVEAERSDSV